MTDPTAGMTAEDRKYWQAVQTWKARRLRAAPREIEPGSWRARAASATTAVREKAGAAVERIPQSERIGEFVGRAFEGASEAGARAGAASVRVEAVLKAYRKKDYEVDRLADIRRLEVTDVQRVKPRLDLAYIAGSAAQGAGTGFLASGGTMIAAGGAVGTGGVAAAPGAGAVVSAMAIDAAAGIITANRAVAHVAAYYGYDLDDPAERVLALGVLSMGLASDAGKLVAYQQFNGIVQALARRQAWQQLSKNQVAQVVGAVYKALGMTLTKKKLATAVPVIGVAVGAGLNARTLARVVDDAEHAYMERFLREKYGLAIDAEDLATSGGVIDAVDAEIVDESD
ncbi:EcsC family protein [Actinomycetospora sp. CA-084318]|uniref:EcsC family protein n=1 Tax=Actinomycetospora sp. CA-084318 TaxID=3239892 RepID=UPI003D9896BC